MHESATEHPFYKQKDATGGLLIQELSDFMDLRSKDAQCGVLMRGNSASAGLRPSDGSVEVFINRCIEAAPNEVPEILPLRLQDALSAIFTGLLRDLLLPR